MNGSEGLPQGLGELFADGGAGRVLDVELPPGRVVVPAGRTAGTGSGYWLSDEPAGADLWVRLRKAHARSGLWPVLADAYFSSETAPVAVEVSPQPADGAAQATAAQVLEDLWTERVSDADGKALAELEPFGRRWPGLAAPAKPGPDPDDFADQFVRGSDDGTSWLLLAAAPSGAGLLTAMGWQGARSHSEDTFLLAVVVRSWEERFGARVIEIGPDRLHLAVAAPPTETGHAEQVAAEHFAVCPDNVAQSLAPTIREYAAEQVLEKPLWSFWWG